MISGILAVDQWGGVGFQGGMPWPRNSADLAHFSQLTKNQVVVMGRNTWDSPDMPCPLPDRINYVFSNRPMTYGKRLHGDPTVVLKQLEQEHPNKTIWVIGGVDLLLQTKSILDTIELTCIAGTYKIDVKIDTPQLLIGFKPVTASTKPGTNCVFISYEKISR